jgi:Fe-S-cluster-containing hydrogenase component 2
MKSSKHSERQFISIDSEKCIGCGLCEYVCALEKEGFPDLSKSRIRVVRLNPWVNFAMACRFCEEAPCVKACSRGALKQSEKGGIIIVDEAKCDACCWCLQACPYGGIVLHPQQKVVACDLCEGKPKCVEFCPEKALELKSDDSDSRRMLVASIEKLPSKIDRLNSIIRRRDWTEMFEEAEEKATRLEEKLEEIGKRQIEIKRENRSKAK